MLEDNLLDARVTKVAHNMPFDRSIARVGDGIDIPLESCFCTMSCAYAHALPGSLEALGPVVGVPNDFQKMSEGKALIQLFCVPDAKGKPKATPQSHPQEWLKFLAYAAQDTAALREIYKRLPKHNYTGEHHAVWILDQEINERGFYIDQELCAKALAMRDDMTAHLEREITELTDGRITKGTQRERVLHEFVGEYGFELLDMQKDNVKTVLDREPRDARERRLAERADGKPFYEFSDEDRMYFLLELRRDSSLSSLAKYERALERVGPDGRMRDTLQFSGAGRTGRWAGRGFQPHNMPRPKTKPEYVETVIIPSILDGTLPQKVDDVNQCCSDALRGTIVAEPGNELLVGDWSNIEGVCNAWEAGAEWKLEVFRENYFGDGPDVYVKLYRDSFGVQDVSKDQRQMGKGMELSLGYGGGVGAFVQTSASYGLNLQELGRVVPEIVPPEVYNKAEKAWQRAFVRNEDFQLEAAEYIACDALKQVWRKQNPEIVQMWWNVERAVKWAIERPGSVQHVARCKIWRTPAWLIIELPSGRRLLYAQPEIKKAVEYDEEEGVINERTVIRYMAATAKQWRRERTYGGKLVENITQAIANDVLRAAMLRANAAGYPLILHVHDEMVAEVPAGICDLQSFLDLMQEPLPWSDGLPLKAAGYTGLRYKKD
jgi:DNA polymerase